MYIGVHVKYRLFLSDCNETWIFSDRFPENFNIKFSENPSSWSGAVLCRETDRWTDGYGQVKNRFKKYTNAPNVQTFNAV